MKAVQGQVKKMYKGVAGTKLVVLLNGKQLPDKQRLIDLDFTNHIFVVQMAAAALVEDSKQAIKADGSHA